MIRTKHSLRETIQFIVDILSFETSHSVLEQQLANTNIDWDAMVVVASEHLVLPAVYCRLQQKHLLDYLPMELKLYLEEITQLNRDRNETLLREAIEISRQFESHNINHTFVKGIALLAGNYYQDAGERMISDIDLLVASKDLDRAFDLLASVGYTESISFNYEIKNFRHRPRQFSNKYLGAVELHDQLLKHGYNHLIDKEMLFSTKEIINGITVPNSEYLIWNTMLAQQINDRCYYFNTLKLKGFYDVLVAGLPHKKHLIIVLSKQKYGSHFLSLASIFYPAIAPTQENFGTVVKKGFFLIKLIFPKFGQLSLLIKAMLIGVQARLSLIIFNKSYREHIFKNKLNKKT